MFKHILIFFVLLTVEFSTVSKHIIDYVVKYSICDIDNNNDYEDTQKENELEKYKLTIPHTIYNFKIELLSINKAIDNYILSIKPSPATPINSPPPEV